MRKRKLCCWGYNVYIYKDGRVGHGTLISGMCWVRGRRKVSFVQT